MKRTLLLPLRNLLWVAVALTLVATTGRAQTQVAQRVDVDFGEPKILSVDRPVDDFTITPDNVVRASKVDGALNELNLTGLSNGNATLSVKSDGRTLLYDIAVSPAPERLYINLNESKRLTFASPIDDTSISLPGIVKVVQPDTSDNVLLVEADTAGKTTLTVYSKGQIYRYFISTFENRGADVLEIENAFSAKGYRNLIITFDKDQAVLTGTVPTQEELDDAVRIVKQYTQFVQVKANLGQDAEQTEYTEEESIIINNIQRIANVPGLTVRVKFPPPQVVSTSTYTKSIGDYVAPTVTTTPQGGTVRGTGFNPPAADPNSLNNTGPLEAKPQQNTTETVTTTKNSSIPEKIFLYGDIADDLQEAKVIRVARTFCPFIVNFLTIRDPIQLRTEIRFLQINHTKTRDTGVFWSGNGPEGGPTVTLGFGQSFFNETLQQDLTNIFTGVAGATGAVSAQAQLELFQNLNIAKLMRRTELLLTNGQAGWYSEGEVRSYVSSSSISITNPPVQTLTQSAVFLGVNMDIAPLNLSKAGGTEPSGQKIFGIPGSIGSGTGGSGYTLEQNTDNSADSVSRLPRAIQEGGTGTPFVDETTKYVDENGLIGIDISTQLSIPNGTFQTVQFGTTGGFLTLPDFFVRTTRTRASLRDGQSVAINGLMDEQTTRSITSVPFLESIPIFGALFRNPVDFKSHEEVIVLVTPHIVRMRDPDSKRFPKPDYPEMIDLAREKGEVPIIKPVRYEGAEAVDLRPESKEAKDGEMTESLKTPGATATTNMDGDSSAQPPLRPHVIGAMKPTLQPPADLQPVPSQDKPAPRAKSVGDSTTMMMPMVKSKSADSDAGSGLSPNSTLP